MKSCRKNNHHKMAALCHPGLIIGHRWIIMTCVLYLSAIIYFDTLFIYTYVVRYVYTRVSKHKYVHIVNVIGHLAHLSWCCYRNKCFPVCTKACNILILCYIKIQKLFWFKPHVVAICWNSMPGIVVVLYNTLFLWI